MSPMATGVPEVPLGGGPEEANAAAQRNWRSAARLSSAADRIEAFLAGAGFDRGPWLAVAFAAGIGTWFLLPQPWQWVAVIALAMRAAIAAQALWRERDARANLRLAVVSLAIVFAAGAAIVWLRRRDLVALIARD